MFMDPVIHLFIIRHVDFLKGFRIDQRTSLRPKICPAQKHHINVASKSIPVFLQILNYDICALFKDLLHILRI